MVLSKSSLCAKRYLSWSGIGGLSKEFADIFRRAFASRVFPPQVVKNLGITHVRGMLLYGPPGRGGLYRWEKFCIFFAEKTENFAMKWWSVLHGCISCFVKRTGNQPGLLVYTSGKNHKLFS